APGALQTVEHRLEHGKCPKGRQITSGNLRDQLLGTHATHYPTHAHHRGITLIAAGAAHADRNLTRRDERAAHHHRLASGQCLPRPGRRVSGQLRRGHTPEQVVGAWSVVHLQPPRDYCCGGEAWG